MYFCSHFTNLQKINLDIEKLDERTIGAREQLMKMTLNLEQMENQVNLFKPDLFPYTYIKKKFLINAPSPPFPPLPSPHTYMHTSPVIKDLRKNAVFKNDASEINACIQESLVKYVSNFIMISQNNQMAKNDSKYDSQNLFSQGEDVTLKHQSGDVIKIDPVDGEIDLELGVALYPVNYELYIGSNIKKKKHLNPFYHV